jgi:hypothetical protein
MNAKFLGKVNPNVEPMVGYNPLSTMIAPVDDAKEADKVSALFNVKESSK